MKISVVSGKGGTGKTTVSASLAYLFTEAYIKADCDVDAANLNLILKGEVDSRTDFFGAKIAEINSKKCIICGRCKEVCRYDAIEMADEKYIVNPLKCEGCNACVVACPEKVIQLKKVKTAEILETTFIQGDFITAEMIPGSEGSGLIVHEIRKRAEKFGNNLLMDGSPGTGCSVIASITNTDFTIIVTEPTKSGLNDFLRVYQLVERFDSVPLLIINKSDINIKITKEIVEKSNELGIEVIGKIPFDSYVNKATNNLKPIIDYKEAKCTKALYKIFDRLLEVINSREKNKTKEFKMY